MEKKPYLKELLTSPKMTPLDIGETELCGDELNYFQISQRESLLVTSSAAFSIIQPLNSLSSTYIPSKFTIVTHL